MDKDELLELFYPTQTVVEGRSQSSRQKLKIAYRELSAHTGIPVEYFDTRSAMQENAVTRAPSESIGNRFFKWEDGFQELVWVCFIRVGVNEDKLEDFADKLSVKFNGVCTTLVLFSTKLDWQVYKIFCTDGYEVHAEKIAEIFEVGDDIIGGLGPLKIFETAPQKGVNHLVSDSGGLTPLPKPILLLAGISGTGKSRFVREQAIASRNGCSWDNYCLVSVRPDWHEPADLLGYVSRITGERFIVTDFLKFIVKAWLNATDQEGNLDFSGMTPHWLCLDEMNLAPVEQYFADYLSVIETRRWEEGQYRSDPLLKATNITSLSDMSKAVLKADLFEGCEAACEKQRDVLYEKFSDSQGWGGIPVPPNLIVAGTVNMDETTHGFSRKVIDRALTLDFQEFFPNDFDRYLENSQVAPITLGLPLYYCSQRDRIAENALGQTEDSNGARTTNFMKTLNQVLVDTPFELAYRALNEALLSVASFGICRDVDDDKDARRLLAVWDDFLMQKVLPRIEGDAAKLASPVRGENLNESEMNLDPATFGSGSILHRLYGLLAGETMLGPIWGNEADDVYDPKTIKKTRPDLLRQLSDMEAISCRSRRKLRWMMHRLKVSHFTDFWC